MFILTAVLKFLLAIFIVILALLILLLIIPFGYRFRGAIKDEIMGEANIIWFFNFFRVRIFKEEKMKFSLFIAGKGIITREISDEKKKQKAKKYKDKKDKKQKEDKESLKEVFKRDFFKNIFRYVKDIINIIRPKYVSIKGIYGFEDPSITGMLCGIVPLISPLIKRGGIKLQPVFEDEIMDIEAEVYGRITIILLVWRTLKLVFSKPIRKIIFKKRKKSETKPKLEVY
ncbi:MAG: DUF2953 domain-containing protein [Bacillota bacterium]|nr:DUF2953 domain-containing protein [Bacillota bacterium]